MRAIFPIILLFCFFSSNCFGDSNSAHLKNAGFSQTKFAITITPGAINLIKFLKNKNHQKLSEENLFIMNCGYKNTKIIIFKNNSHDTLVCA